MNVSTCPATANRDPGRSNRVPITASISRINTAVCFANEEPLSLKTIPEGFREELIEYVPDIDLSSLQVIGADFDLADQDKDEREVTLLLSLDAEAAAELMRESDAVAFYGLEASDDLAEQTRLVAALCCDDWEIKPMAVHPGYYALQRDGGHRTVTGDTIQELGDKIAAL